LGWHKKAKNAAPPINYLADTLVEFGSWFTLQVCKLELFLVNHSEVIAK
jgi:hypothetical protein